MANPVIFESFKVCSPRKQFLSAAIFVLVFCAFPTWAQQAAGDSSQTSPDPVQDGAAAPAEQKPDAPGAKTDGAAPKPMTPAEERQAQLVADTNKLYQLAQELQAEVAKSSKNTLSLAVVKKAAEVERLAKSLKERMKTESACESPGLMAAPGHGLRRSSARDPEWIPYSWCWRLRTRLSPRPFCPSIDTAWPASSGSLRLWGRGRLPSAAG